MSLHRTRGWTGRQRGLEGEGWTLTTRQRTGQEPGGGARPGPHNQEEEDQNMDCQPAAAPEEMIERGEEPDRIRLNTRSQALAKQKKVTFLQATTDNQEFESVCTKRQDGTIDLQTWPGCVPY